MDYQDSQIAALYEVANPWAEDTDFYLSLAGLPSCSVLDLSCGTGTLGCGLAQHGHRVTGVDRAAATLAVARRKPYAERVAWVESLAQTYRSEQRFDLIVLTGHAFRNLLNGAHTPAVFETMRRHVKKRGRVAFDSRTPRIDWAGEGQRVLGSCPENRSPKP